MTDLPEDLEPDEAPNVPEQQPGIDGFFEDAGPVFDPDNPPEFAEEAPERSDDEIGWTADGVASFLRDVQAPAFNAMLNPLLGVSETDWAHREKRLAQISPAIAREWNRIPHIKALAGHTDRAVILSYFLLEYFPPRAFDVVEERRQRRAQAAAEAEELGPIVERGAPERPVDHGRPTGLPPRRRS